MPFVQVYAMFQDSKGFLYTGGYGGLCRFDGKEFVNTTTKEGLVDNYVNAVCEDANGRIFVGTKKGVSLFDNGKILRELNLIDLNEKNITCIKKDKTDKILIGTNNGLYFFYNNELRKVSKTNDFEIKDILVTKDNIYCASNKGLLIFKTVNDDGLEVYKQLSSNNINCLAESPDKTTIAIGTTGGLNLLNVLTKKSVALYVQNGLIDNNISCLVYREKGGLWIGSQSGLIKYKNNEFSYFNIYFDNNSNLIRTLLIDFEGNLWVGTHSGIYRYRDNSFSTFDNISGPGKAFIFEIFNAGNDMFICSENNGIYKYTDGYFKRYSVKDGLTSNVCRSGAATKNGRLFFDSEGSIVELVNDKFKSVQLSKQVKGPFYKIFCDSKNKVIFGGTNGIATIDYLNKNKSDTSFIKIPNKGHEFQVTDMCEDDEGNLWASVYFSGLYCIKNNIVIDYGEKLKLDKYEFISVRYHNKHLYAATLSGLLVINLEDESVKVLKQEDGLISDIVYSIGFAKNKEILWVGTNIGISELNIKILNEKHEIKINNYSKNEGFAGIECNTNGIFEDKEGTVWFGTIGGLIKYIPNNYKRNTLVNNTVIYKIMLGDKDTLLKNKVELPYDKNNITFYYRGICFTNPEKVLYKKKLLGYDKVYSLQSLDNNSKYTNLEPGTYTFQVLSCNNEGMWNDTPTEFIFTIKTPYYRTWWFTLIVIITTFLTVYLVFKIRVNSIKQKQQKDFERKVEISKIELKALRSQMNPHFVFNSLNSIQHYIFNSKSDEAVKYLNKFAKLMRVILNNSDKPTVAIEDDLEALKLYLELEQMRFEDKFDYKIEIDGNVDLDYDIMPPMLLQPYVENAILHGLTPKNEKGLLTVKLRSEGNFIVCTIEDNGIGRKKAAEIKRTMPGSKHKSFGMKITEERLRILNEISMSRHSVVITDLYNNDGKGIGTKVELFVPIL